MVQWPTWLPRMTVDQKSGAGCSNKMQSKRETEIRLRLLTEYNAYDVDPREGDRFSIQPFHSRIRSEPNERDYPLFSSSEGEDFNVGYEDQFYSNDVDVTSQRPQTTFYTGMPDMSVDERLLPEDDSYDDNIYAGQEAIAGVIEPHPIRDRVTRQQYPSPANEYMIFQDRERKQLTPNLPRRTMLEPVTWNPSRDGRRLIGHMILRRKADRVSGDVGSLLGLKVVGGRRTHSGHLGAFITRVKPGSPADVIGQLQAGDEVLEWNGSSLKDLMAEEVSQIIQETRDAPQIELIVQRENEYAIEIQLICGNECGRKDDLNMRSSKVSHQIGKYEWVDSTVSNGRRLKLSFDPVRHQLIVHVFSASELSSNCVHKTTQYNACSSYCRIRLLPGRDEMKYSKMISDNNNPDWNQVFKFVDYTEQEIVQHDLELTVWNCEMDTNEQTLLGEVIIDLSVADLTGGTYWYPLRFNPRSEYSSEAATPVIGADQEYAKRQMKPFVHSVMDDQVDSLTPFVPLDHHTRDIEVRSPIHPSVDHRRRSQQQHPGDYSDLDQQRSSTHAGITSRDYRYDRSPLSTSRGQPIHPRKHADYNYDESMAHSDASEFSDVSEFSRMSLQTTQSEKPHHLSPHSSERSPYQKPSPQSTGSSKTVSQQFPHHRQFNRSSPSNDPYEQPRISRGPIDEHSARRRAGSGHSVERNQLAKESSSSECGSSLLTTSGGETVSQYLKPDIAIRTVGDRPSQIEPSGRTDGRKPRPSIGHKFSTVLGRSHKSSSTSNLDKKGRNRFQRCEEVLPFGTQDSLPESQYGPADEDQTSTSIRRSTMQQQSSLGSMRAPMFGNLDGTDQDSRASPSLSRNESHVGEFVEGLGPGQLVGRQVLGMPCLGEIQLSFFDRKGHLEVEVIRARGLQHKNTAKPIPAPYVKLHLLEGKQSVEKIRTTTPPRRTLDPLYQQQLTFSMPYHGRIIQVSVWGEYGRMDKKVFLGMCEVVLDDLDLKNVVFGWYKLFGMIASSAHHQHHNPTAKFNQSESQSTMDSHSNQTQSKGLSEQSPPKTRQSVPGTRIKKSPFTR
ncbi:hypothetical protein EG68_06271 [Paragonimus skrjabini miyazakii]|uniref:Regulating synaptic membrane exocytosis protein 2 n=1 Tax=Paragonimus skrjabini miyazakii TaxID=59628 RepID=A0A8S9YGN2_9TREM|nr:hypothetical protein EG68_06271 [Paragonimus skrjabini miyazakii]